MIEGLLAGLYDRIKAYDDGDASVVLVDEALEEAGQLRRLTEPAEHGPRPLTVALTLAYLHWCRYLELPVGRERPDLDAALRHFAEVEATAPTKVPDKAKALLAERAALDGEDAGDLARRAIALLRGVQHRDDPAALDEGIDLLRRLLRGIPAEHINRTRMQANLDAALALRFERTGGLADLDEAIRESRATIASTDPEDPDRPRALATLAASLGMRFERTGEVRNLHSAIDALREALEGDLDDEGDYGTYLSNLAGLLQSRFRLTGTIEDLNESVALSRTAVNLTDLDAADRAAHLSALCTALQMRFDYVGELADLNEAIVSGRAALTAIPARSPSWSGFQSNLSQALLARFEATGEATDVDEAITAARAAVDGNHAERRTLPLARSALSIALQARYEKTGNPRDLDEAIEQIECAARATAQDDPSRGIYRSNLSRAYLLRSEGHRRRADARRAVAAAKAAVRACDPDDPDLGNFLANLGSALHVRFRLTGRIRHADAALDAWKSASGIAAAPTVQRLNNAVRRASLAASLGRWAVAADAYAEAVHYLPRLSALGASRHSGQRLLRAMPGLASDAAACAAAVGRVDQAVELLEVGRGVLWARQLDIDTDFEDLRRALPDVAGRLDAIRRELSRPVTALQREGRHTPAVSFVDRRVALAREWSALVDHVRTLPRFSHFMTAPGPSDLLPSLMGGAVAIVNVSRWGCCALLLTAAGMKLLPLPQVTIDEVAERANKYVAAVEGRHSDASDRDEAIVSETLEWLWDTIADPILTTLHYPDSPEPGKPWPRIWWCPTGPLTMLPIHAAGYHQEADETLSRSVLDRAISSYAPTLRALLRARENPIASGQAHDLLFVGLRRTPGHSDLPGVEREKEILISQFGDEHTLVLCDEHATSEAVMRHLPAFAWAHFSCHGGQNVDEPAKGGLRLHDKALRISDLVSTRSRGEFIFLSACDTAVGGRHLLDEIVTLAAALQYGGWRHVIATLSVVKDRAAAVITERTYAYLRASHGLHANRSADALHFAVRHQRDDDRQRPSLWAPFMHAGP